MTARTTFGRLRHPLAALLALGGVVVGSVAAVGGSPAVAAPGDELVGTTVFTCTSAAAPDKPFEWNGTLTLSAFRPTADSTAVTVVAELSKMAGTVPLDVGTVPVTEILDLDLAGTSVKLNGSGTTEIKADTDFALPNAYGTLTSSAADLAVTVNSFSFSVTAMGSTLATSCVVKSGDALGNLKIVVGVAPTPTPAPTTTVPPTSTPTPSPTATASVPQGSKGGKPAKGSATFACVLSPLNSKFDYNAKISVSGFRAEAGDDVSLTAAMSDLPAISPVPIAGSMDYTLDATVGGKKVTLKSTDNVNAAPKEEVPVKNLTGTVGVDGDELEVKVSKFTFNFPSAGIGADCVAASPVSLGKMTVGSEPTDEDENGGGGEAPVAAESASSGGTLPKTGGGDSLPVVALWALALTLLGAAGLLCVPQVARKRS